jgi:hypothetical protein
MKQALFTAYFWITQSAEPIAAWLLNVTSHGDHLGHPFF